ncbi:MAG: MBL fold metallo-hydrolase [Nitriliruptorales bacterium]
MPDGQRLARGWDEVGEGVFRRRYRDSFDLNCGLVLGDGRALLVDSRCHEFEAAQLREEIGRLTAMPIQVVVNTHGHFDHCFGNAVFVDSELWGQVGCARYLAVSGERQRAVARELMGSAAGPALEAARIVPPDHLVADATTLLIAGRPVRLAFLGKGHTDHDLVVAVDDVKVIFAGDLVEEGAPPAFEDAYPTEWPATLGRLIEFAGDATLVPGHGDLVNRAFVRRQQQDVRAVSDLCHDVAAGTIATGDAVAASPYPATTTRTALTRPL